MLNRRRGLLGLVIFPFVFVIVILACNTASPPFESGEPIQIASGHIGGISSIALDPGNCRIATGGVDNVVKLWDVRTRRLEKIFEGHTGAISSLVFSPDGFTLVSGSFDRTAKVWDTISGKLKVTISNHPSGQLKGLSFSPDGKVIAGAGADGVRLWRADTGRLLHFFPSSRGSLVAAFSPDGKIHADAGGAGIRLWSTDEGRLLRQLNVEEPELVTSIAFSPDGRLLASGGNSQTVRLWDVGKGDLKSSVDGHGWIRALVFLADGETLLGADRSSARVWNLKTSSVKRMLRSDSPLTSVALSSQNTIWAGGDTGGTLRIWRVRSE